MRIRKISFTGQMSFALGFGLAAAVLFWWEASEPIWKSSWSGSAEQWLALASVGIGLCATLAAIGGALSAVSKTTRRVPRRPPAGEHCPGAERSATGGRSPHTRDG
jgi:hypothetical protein